jgi:Arc/MetJ-type ribon-helix-helix transcriptional regulator
MGTRQANIGPRPVRGMVFGMATTKITVTLPDRQLEEIRRRVATKKSPSISRFVQQAVQKSLDNAAEFRAMVENALNETGGPLKPKERAWARKMLSPRTRGTRPRESA